MERKRERDRERERERKKDGAREGKKERKRARARTKARERKSEKRGDEEAGAWRKAARKSRKAGDETNEGEWSRGERGRGRGEGVIKGVNINTGEFSPRGRSWRDGTRARRFRTARSRSPRYLRAYKSRVGVAV